MSAGTQAELRFAFGENWAHYLAHLNDERITRAQEALRTLTGELIGRTFLDIGSGSGIHSLAAVRLGAARVHSFDLDAQSVACTSELKRRYYPGAAYWTVESGSALDKNYTQRLGQFDVVYSWGVLHHTGNMWRALELAGEAVAPGGLLALAIYNDQGFWSRYWRVIKRVCNRMPRSLQPVYAALTMAPVEGRELVKSLLKLRPQQYVQRWTRHYSDRGMSRWHDIVDWVGGYPFEVAKPEEVFEFYRKRGFALEKLTTSGGSKACNEFVFCRRELGHSPGEFMVERKKGVSTEVTQEVAMVVPQALTRSLHHVGFAVTSIAAAAEAFAGTLGAEWDGEILSDPLQEAKVSFLRHHDTKEPMLELIEPAGADSPLYGFLKRGGGLHHLCYEVNCLEAQLESSRASGALIVKPPLPAVAFEGRRIAWVYTKQKLLVEYLEREKKVALA
jgi:2-polyprenyl-3-methyl-5-hydroxy-6-metoxy-1,4-benzoquinol methylase/catechol 2,3-dioxygenase-like lactoylglutathione lyase family enzyme